MSATPQSGRRRAEPARRTSLFGLATAGKGTRTRTHAAGPTAAVSAVTTTAKCMAAVAVVGALVAAGAVAQQVGAPTASGQNLTSLVSSVDTSSPATAPAVSAPGDAAISFPSFSATSRAVPKPTEAAIKAEGDVLKAAAAPAPAVTPAPAPAPAPAPVDDPAGAQAFASGQLATFGWGADQMSCLTQLWERESSWLTSAENASSGAYGIAQSLPATKMESTGSDWSTNYQTQIRWGLGYIQERYGSPCSAWGHSNAVGWY